MGWTDWIDGIGMGALGGAATGFMAGGPLGAGIGAVAGGGLGAYGEYQGQKKKGVLNDAARRSHEMAMEARKFQMDGMERALGQMGNSKAAYDALYGDPKKRTL